MLVVVVCSALALCGLALIIFWGRFSLTPPDAAAVAPTSAPSEPAVPASAPPAPARAGLGQRLRTALRRYLWWATAVTVVCFGTALLWTLPASRLIMRVLALTSPDATGFTTEAREIVGEISVQGTLALLVFGVLPGTFLSTVGFALVHRWLPRGWLGGLLYGALLLVVVSPVNEPLRAANPDFDIVGPGWLSVLLFGVLVLGHGLLLAALFGWYSRRMPLRPAHPWLAHLPLLAAVAYPPVGVALLLGAALTALGAALFPSLGRWWASPALRWPGRIALALLALISLPGFVAAIISITTR